MSPKANSEPSVYHYATNLNIKHSSLANLIGGKPGAALHPVKPRIETIGGEAAAGERDYDC